MKIELIGLREGLVMVLVPGYTFPEGRSYRLEYVEQAIDVRRDIQEGRVPLRPYKRAHFLFEAEDEFEMVI